MDSPYEPPATVRVGRRELPLLVAALLAQESDRLRILPSKVGDVVIPDPAPKTVRISEYDLPIDVAAQIAVEAEAKGQLPEDVMAGVIEEWVQALEGPKGPPVGKA